LHPDFILYQKVLAVTIVYVDDLARLAFAEDSASPEEM
jgi:hypothetical protein